MAGRIRALPAGLAVLLGTATSLAFTSTNSVPPTRAGDETVAIDPDAAVLPPACAGMPVETTLSGAGALAGTAGNDHLVGSSSADTISGLGGADCIEGLGEADTIDGGPGDDVCIGGPGADVFVSCETQVD